jgi:hypothetical protein
LASATSLSKFTGQVLSSSVNRYWTQVKHPTVPSLLVGTGDRFYSLVADEGGASDVEGGLGLSAAGAGAALSLGAGSSSAS